MNFTQNDVAFYIGSDKSVISSIETVSKKNISILTLVKISQVLGVSVVDLLSDMDF